MSCSVYFAKSKLGEPIKIGISKNPLVRLGHNAELLGSIRAENRTEAFRVETSFHKAFANQRVLDEWYGINPDLQWFIDLAQPGITSDELHTKLDEVCDEVPA